jgi:hypothetical protein
MPANKAVSSLILAAFFFLLSACGGRPRGYAPDNALTTPFLPPTAPATDVPATLSVAGTVEPPRPTPTPPCLSDLEFVDDLSIPDGAQVKAGEHLDKRWVVKNSGMCNWDEGYRVRLIAGPDLGAPREQALLPARSGAEVTLRIQFTAPNQPGTYRSAWQAHDPSGQPFGDLFFIEFSVTE